MRTWILLFIFTCLLCKPIYAHHLVFITHKSTKIKEINSDYIKRIYTGQPVIKKVSLKPTMLPMSHIDTKAFIKKYLKMSEFEFDQFWLAKELSGQEITPKSFYNAKKLVNFIKSNKGYIGYVNKKYVPKDKVKIYKVQP